VNKSKTYSRDFAQPLLVMNGFGVTDNQPVKVTGMMLQSLFPPINVANQKIEHMKRVVIL
jgi:hypothetical protein